MACEGLSLEGVMSHLASADDPGCELTRAQLKAFSEAVTLVEAVSEKRLFRHISNSTAAVMIPGAQHDLVRPGIMLYGAHMSPATRTEILLEPAFLWKARIRQVKAVKAGETVGYGGVWTAPKDSRVAVLSVGYADGFVRSLTNRTEVVIGGKRVPVVGRVSMDLITADVTEVPDAKSGDAAVLLGSSGSASVPAEEWADRLGTITYEVFTNVSRRVPRVHKGMAAPW